LIPGTPYTQTAVQIGTGDLIVLYTDGVTESTDHTGVRLDRHGVFAMANRIMCGSASQTGGARVEW